MCSITDEFADPQRLKNTARHKDMTLESGGAHNGEMAPEFLIEISYNNLPLHHLAGFSVRSFPIYTSPTRTSKSRDVTV